MTSDPSGYGPDDPDRVAWATLPGLIHPSSSTLKKKSHGYHLCAIFTTRRSIEVQCCKYKYKHSIVIVRGIRI